MSYPSLEGLNSLWEVDMYALAIFVSVFVSIFLAFLALFLSGEQSTAAQDKARARRLADARMNARLLRLNI
jgi:hypothetical protein